jgi:hypothetical protein
MHMPLSKQRNKHIQRTLVEAAKLAPRQSHELAVIYDKEKQKGNGNRATLAVARKMVAYLLAWIGVTRHSNRGKCTVRPSYCSQIAEFRACLYSNRGQSGWERTPHKGSREEV